jgi:hypothetical protein
VNLKPVPFAIGAYADDARPFTSQDCLGYLPVNAEAEGTRSPVIARQVPGLREVANIPGITRQRGARNVEGRLCIVGNQSLIQLLPSFGAVVLGSVPGIDRVGMAHGQIADGNQLLITTGDSGYVYNTVTNAVERITDAGYPGAICVDYIGGVFVQVEPQRRYAFNSAIADGMEYNALETFQGESKPDRIRRALEYSGEIVLLSETSIERFDYTGTVNELFRNKKIFGMRGCASTHAVDKLDEAVFFIGDDGSGYEMRGYEMRRITTHAIEQAWRRCDAEKAYSFAWQDKGHKVWYVTFPDGFTWGYDCATRKWHRRKSFDLDHWRLAWLEKWEGEWYGGDYNSGRIFKLDWTYAMEGDDPLERAMVGGVLHHGGERVRVNALLTEWNCSGESSTYTAGVGLLLSGDLPDAYLGDVISYSYTATGTPGYTFSLIGVLPTGLAMNASGVVTGTTTASGSFSWQVKVVDSTGATATLTDTCVVAASSRRYIAGLDGGKLCTAQTPSSWTAQATGLGATENITALTACAGLYLIGTSNTAGNEKILSSPDGVTWTQRVTVAVGTGGFTAAAARDGIALVGGGNGGSVLYKTTDGINFASKTLGYNTNVFSGLACGIVSGSRVWIGVFQNGQVVRSVDDGENWTNFAVGSALTGVCWSEEHEEFMAVGGSGQTYTSASGASGTWTLKSSQGGANYSFVSVASGPFGYIAGTNNAGTIYPGIYHSTDRGATWVQRNNVAGNVFGATYLDGFYAYIRPAGVVGYSTNAQTWTELTLPGMGAYAGNAILGTLSSP